MATKNQNFAKFYLQEQIKSLLNSRDAAYDTENIMKCMFLRSTYNAIFCFLTVKMQSKLFFPPPFTCSSFHLELNVPPLVKNKI